jgi:hypothetical protein
VLACKEAHRQVLSVVQVLHPQHHSGVVEGADAEFDGGEVADLLPLGASREVAHGCSGAGCGFGALDY